MDIEMRKRYFKEAYGLVVIIIEVFRIFGS